MKYAYLFISLFLSSIYINAQVNTDSLKHVWNNKTLPDTVRLLAANDLAWEYHDTWELDIAMDYATKSLNLCVLKELPDWEYHALNIQSNIYLSQSNYKMALHGFKQGLKIGELLTKSKLIALANNNIGNVYFDQGNYPKAHKHYLTSLKISENSNNRTGIANSLYSIGKVYSREGEDLNAKEFFLASLRIEIEDSNMTSIGSNYNGLGLAYESLGDIDSAIYYYTKSLEIDSLNNDLLGIATSLNNIGIVYDNQENYTQALAYYHRSLRVEKEIKDYVGIMGSLCNIGMVNHNLGDYKKAIEYNNQALVMNEKAHYNDYLLNVYYSLYESHKELGQYQESLEMLELFTVLNDSIFNIEASRSLLKQETEYEYEKSELIKQQELKNLERMQEEQTSRRNNLQYYGITLGLLVLFGLLFFASKFELPKWLISFATFLPILILFEFLLVLLDVYIELWSGGIPAYKLLINVGLAGLIFPLHTFFEALFRRKLFKG